MPTSATKGAARPARVDKAHLVLRARHPALLLAHPNYVGTVLDSDLLVIAPVKGNTSFETLTCVGLNPALDQAEAVVRVNANPGYGGTLCNGGSREYVRFFVSSDSGANWVDVGMDSFSVHSAQTILCVDGTTRANVRLRLDEVAPTSSFSITHFIRGGTTFPAQECRKFKLADHLRSVDVPPRAHGRDVGHVGTQHRDHGAVRIRPAPPGLGPRDRRRQQYRLGGRAPVDRGLARGLRPTRSAGKPFQRS